MFSKIVSFLRKPAVSHFLAGVFGSAATYFASGHVDLSPILRALGGQ